MPKLCDDTMRIRMEALAKLVADGQPVYKAAIVAGWGKKFAENGAYDLIKTPAYRAIWEAELARRRADMAHITREWLQKQMQEIADNMLAHGKRYASTTTQAEKVRLQSLQAIAKLAGMDETTVKVQQLGPLVIVQAEPTAETEPKTDQKPEPPSGSPGQPF